MANQQHFSSSSHYVVINEDEESESYQFQDFAAPSTRISRNFKTSSVSVGLLVGFSVQMTTLGINVLILDVRGQEYSQMSQKDIAAFSLVWSFMTSAMAIAVLTCVRALATSFIGLLPIEPNKLQLTEAIQNEMIQTMEFLFVVGALVGVTLAWIATDVLLGMEPQFNYSIVTLSTALLWCRGVWWFHSQQKYQAVAENDDDEADLFLPPTKRNAIMVV